jgi:hypothetical protein
MQNFPFTARSGVAISPAQTILLRPFDLSGHPVRLFELHHYATIGMEIYKRPNAPSTTRKMAIT